jgi:hypothetical protein
VLLLGQDCTCCESLDTEPISTAAAAAAAAAAEGTVSQAWPACDPNTPLLLLLLLPLLL